MMVLSVVGCGGRHDVLIVSIFLHLFEKVTGRIFCYVTLVKGLHKNAFHHASQCNGHCSDTSLKIEVCT